MTTATAPTAAAPARRADGFTGRNIGALLLGHCAGMLDLVALGGTLLVGTGYTGLGFGVAGVGLLAAVFFFLMHDRHAAHQT